VNEAYRAKIFLGELTLGDLLEMGLLEGLMKMDDNERITAGSYGDSVEFCGPNAFPNRYPARTKVKLNTSHLPKWAVEFEGRTLVLSRDMDSFLENKDEKNP
jgi:hypothetical protein